MNKVLIRIVPIAATVALAVQVGVLSLQSARLRTRLRETLGLVEKYDTLTKSVLRETEQATAMLNTNHTAFLIASTVNGLKRAGCSNLVVYLSLQRGNEHSIAVISNNQTVTVYKTVVPEVVEEPKSPKWEPTL